MHWARKSAIHLLLIAGTMHACAGETSTSASDVNTTDTVPDTAVIPDTSPSDTTIPDTLPLPDIPASPSTLPPELQAIISLSCSGSGCHTGGQSLGGLNLDPGNEEANLINVPAAGKPDVMRVVPGDPGNSLLIWRLRALQGTGLMPPAYGVRPGPLAEADIALFEAWIQGLATTPPTEDVTQPADADVVEDTTPTEDTAPPPEDTAPPEDIGPPPLPDCEPALLLTPEDNMVPPYGMALFTPSGGTGQYLFEIDNPDAVISFNPLTGDVLAGDLVGVVTTVTLKDAGCVGEATAQIETLDVFTAVPMNATVAPSGCVQIQPSGGSGTATYAFQKQETTSTISDAGLYTAGDTDGVDVIRITDPQTQEYALTVIRVETGASIEASARQLVVPVGSQIQSPFGGGSGVYTLTTTSDAIAIEGNSIVATQAGTAILTATDKFIGCGANDPSTQSPPVDIQVSSSLTAPTLRVRANATAIRILGAGDLNGDGFPDGVLSASKESYQGNQSGVAFIYAGTAEGLAPEPTQVLSTTQRSARFGHRIALGDFDGDGQKDLAVGAPASSAIPANVHLFKGVPNGFFQEPPLKKLVGPGGWGNAFGVGVTACDFNNDGFDDLAVGVTGLVDKSLENPPSGQGGFYVYLGRPEGISDTPQQIRFGNAIDLDGNPIAKSLRIGGQLESGDINGDGACDLVALATGFPIPTDATTSALFVYKGVPATADSKGGVTLLPVKGYASKDGIDSTLSHFVVAHADEDDNADIVATFPYGGNLSGGVGVLNGGPLGDTLLTNLERLPVKTDPDTLLCDGWCYFYGWGGWPYFGLNSVFVADMNADGAPDIVTGQYRVAGFQGSLALFLGSATDGFPDAITHQLEGTSLASGTASIGVAAPLADVDGDGAPEVMVFSSGNDDFGKVGRPFLVPGTAVLGTDPALNDGSATLLEKSTALQYPGKRAGASLGSNMAILGDLDGDGFQEVATATSVVTSEGGGDSGAILIYRGTATGSEKAPASVVAGFKGSSGWQKVGGGTRSGDFNGDGHMDWSTNTVGKAHPTYFVNDEAFDWPAACATKLGDKTGHVVTFVFSGGLDALPASGEYQPSFAYYSDIQTNTTAMLDYNGDGYADLVKGNAYVKDDQNSYAGRMEIVEGRPFTPGKIAVACEPDQFFLGAGNNVGRIGYPITRVGDLNGDGCEEFATIANAAPYGKTKNLYIFYGWGPQCDYATVHYTALTGVQFGDNNLTTITAADMDGDGGPDIVVSNASRKIGDDQFGAIWLIPSSRLTTLPTEPYVEGQGPTNLPLFVDPTMPGLHMLTGKVPSGRFGESLSMVPDLGGPGRAAVIVGSPGTESGGKVNTGGAFIYQFSVANGGLDPIPMARIMGETYRQGSNTGSRVLGLKQGNQPMVMVGSNYGTPFDATDLVDNGSIYLAPLSAEP